MSNENLIITPDKAIITPAMGKAKLDTVHTELNKGVIGNHKVIELILLNMLLKKGHILFSGVPGVAKTHLLKCLARAIKGLNPGRVSCTPDLLPSSMIGGLIFDRVKQIMVPLFGPAVISNGAPVNFLLLDEFNRLSPKAQSAFLELMEELQITVGDTQMKMPPLFMVGATYNPIDAGGTGTFPIIEAGKDRYMSGGYMGYLDTLEEEMLMNSKYHGAHGNLEEEVEAVITVDEILQMRHQVELIAKSMSAAANSYMVRLVWATRPGNYYFDKVHGANAKKLAEIIQFGDSPRGTIALQLDPAAAHAYRDGRDNITEKDILFAFKPALAHRMIITSVGLMDTNANEVLDTVLKQVPFDAD